MGAHTNVDVADLLQAFVDRIIDQVTEFNANTCYLCLDPDAVPEPNSGSLICCVGPTSGIFDAAKFEGGGSEQATVNSGIIVKIHSPVRLDQPGRDAVFLSDSSKGVLKVHKRIMKALLEPWMPQVGGNDALRDFLEPGEMTFTKARKGNRSSMGGLEQTFRAVFDMNLD